MKIKEILSQHRRDFTAVYECEHCADFWVGTGYDDFNFHNHVIPHEMVCGKCHNKSPDDYQPLMPLYSEGTVI